MVKYKTARQEALEAKEDAARENYATFLGVRALKQKLSDSIRAVGSLFEMWDTDGDGQISKEEFTQAVAALGVNATPRVYDLVFDEFDPDESQTIGYEEFLNFALRDALARSASRVMDFFKKFDADESGEIGPGEFREAVSALGYDVPRQHLDAIFATMDEDGSGHINFRELHRHLRQGNSIKLKKSLRKGGAGKIRMSTNERFNADPYADPSQPDKKTPLNRSSPVPFEPANRPTTAPPPSTMAKGPIPEAMSALLPPPPTAPNLAPPPLGQLLMQNAGAPSAAPQRSPSLFKLTITGDLTTIKPGTAPAGVGGRRPERYPRPGGGGGPRSPEGRFIGYAAHGLVVCNQPRRRSILDEKTEIAAQRFRGEELAFTRKTVPGYRGHSWREPLPAITHDKLPVWTGSCAGPFNRVHLPEKPIPRGLFASVMRRRPSPDRRHIVF